MRLPYVFWHSDANSAKGGCKRAFLSTETDIDVALMYAADGPMPTERWGAGVETQKNVRGEVGDGVEYHLMSPTPRR